MSFLIGFLLSFNLFAECVHVGSFDHQELLRLSNDYKVFVQIGDQFHPLTALRGKLKTDTRYLTHYSHKDEVKNLDRYNDTYLPYYRYSRIQQFLASKNDQIKAKNYQLKVIGKSLKGRDRCCQFSCVNSSGLLNQGRDF